MNKVNRKINSTEIISPTRGEKYTIADILRKGIERRGVDWISITPKLEHTCFYESKDVTVNCHSVSSMKSQWNESVNFVINGIVPMHQTKDGKLSVGFGCGCDKEHGGQFPSNAPPNNKDWADYKNQELGEILIWTEEKQETVLVKDILHDEKSCKILAKILRQIFAEEFLCSLN